MIPKNLLWKALNFLDPVYCRANVSLHKVGCIVLALCSEASLDQAGVGCSCLRTLLYGNSSPNMSTRGTILRKIPNYTNKSREQKRVYLRWRFFNSSYNQRQGKWFYYPQISISKFQEPGSKSKNG